MHGELSEWSNVSFSKSDEAQASGGSNPPLSAKIVRKIKHFLLQVMIYILHPGKNEQEGYRMLFIGMWKALRNPNAHFNKNLTINEARNQLYFLSILMYKIDICMIKAHLED